MERDIRDAMLTRLTAAVPYLKTASIHECARELVVQGLDLVEPSDRQRVILAALDELNDPDSREL